ncbi:hypothetical protein [Microtetraspora malaysiensis]|uniref:hypothetical protein n=1 Tax=Microtetraspora malaysiensis TaxID=161358 RepID=UPI003D932B85
MKVGHDTAPDLHTARPSVYLDQWVWIRLARANVGNPAEPLDNDALDAVRTAAAAGVAFPLSATHYFETTRIKHPKQRSDLAAVMAPISRLLNLRAQEPLIRHQILLAMHETFGRPAFRPDSPAVLGLGAFWAILGKHVPLRLMKGQREAEADNFPELATFLRSANQLAETKLLAGPRDEEISRLRALGYSPEEIDASNKSRLDWEAQYKKWLEGNPTKISEMRVHLVVRELIHEHFDTLASILTEYRLDISRLMHADPDVPGTMRADMMRFCDRIPTMRIAAELKLEIFRNSSRQLNLSMMRDIDAISSAMPYCHVVMIDNDAAHLLRRTGAERRHQTKVITRFEDLMAKLPELIAKATSIADKSGWDSIGPPTKFCTDWSDLPRPNRIVD